MSSVASTAQRRLSIGRGRAARHRTRTGGATIVLAIIAVLFLLPLLWILLASFNATATLKVSWPGDWTLANFRSVLNTDTTYRPMLNGLLLCAGGTIITVVGSVLAAYPLSRYRSRLRRPFLLTILFATGLPITAIMVPVYTMFVRVNLIDSIPAAMFFMGASALPLSIWLMKNFMDGVPVVLEEAAWADGATNMQALRTIVLPMMWPGVIVVTIYAFINMWGNFFVPFILLLSPDKLPASVSIYTFFDPHGAVQYGQLAAFSILYCIPVLVLYLLMARRLGGGFAMGGALKG